MGGTLPLPEYCIHLQLEHAPRSDSNCVGELESYIPFPPLQDPASYNLVQVLEQVKKMGKQAPEQGKTNRRVETRTGGLMWPPAFAASGSRSSGFQAHQGVSECAEPIVNAARL